MSDASVGYWVYQEVHGSFFSLKLFPDLEQAKRYANECYANSNARGKFVVKVGMETVYEVGG